MICRYNDTCDNKTIDCEDHMPSIHAKPVVDGKFWIVEEGEQKVGVLKLTEQKKYVFSSRNNITTFDNKKKVVEQFGKEFFSTIAKEPVVDEVHEVHGFPSSSAPQNPMYDVKRHLPLFTKSDKSKSVYCAGYYIIKFDKGWVKSFCPKLITVERYPFQGPFKTDLEMKQRLSNVTR